LQNHLADIGFNRVQTGFNWVQTGLVNSAISFLNQLLLGFVSPEKLVRSAEELALEAHFVVSARLRPFPFEVPDADLTPVGRGHFSCEKVFDLALGLEGFVGLAGFSFEDDGAGEQAVTGSAAG
jgi:hypothetical protein